MAILASVLALPAAPSLARSLLDELQDLTVQHPQVRAGQELVAAGEHGIDRAFSGFLPRVSFVGDVGRETTDSPSTRDNGGDGEFTGTRRKATLSLTQNIFEGLRTQSQLAGAKFQRDVANNDLETTRQRILFEGAAAYFDVLKGRRLIELAQQNIDTIQSQLRLEDERLSRGSGISVDVLFARSRLQLAQERLVAFEGELRNARSRYMQVFNHPADPGIAEPPRLTFVGLDRQQAIDVALREHPEVRGSLLRADVAQEKTDTAKANFFPRFDIIGRANYENDVEGINGRRHDYSIGLQGSYDLFKGFADKAEVSQAKSELSAVRVNHFHVTRKVMEQAEIAWHELDTLRKRRELLAKAVEIANEVFESRKRLRDAGKETALNVLDAENEVYLAAINATRAQFDERIAEFRLLQTMGRLTMPTLLANRP